MQVSQQHQTLCQLEQHLQEIDNSDNSDNRSPTTPSIRNIADDSLWCNAYQVLYSVVVFIL